MFNDKVGREKKFYVCENALGLPLHVQICPVIAYLPVERIEESEEVQVSHQEK